MNRRSTLRALTRLAGLAPALALSGQVQAQTQANWPTRPVKLIVPGGPGSGTDVVSRVFAELLGQAFKQPFVVDNRAGANGMLGSQIAKAAAPDGYTLLFTYAAAQVVNQTLYDKAGYDGARDFEAIAQIGGGGNLLVVRSDVPANNLQEFIAWARRQPEGSIAYGSWGVGSGGHLSMEALCQATGLKMRHVPYKTAAASNQDIIAGHIQAGFAATAASLPHIQAGRLKAVAISGTVRVPALPQVATMTEQGVKFDVNAWYGVFAPKGTPRPIIEAVNREVNRLVGAPEQAERWKTLGFAHMPQRTPEEFAQQVQADIRDWGDVVRKGNIKPE
ncbi:MAG: Bug family tripartite tricarboxylate transporter substrate binding protein [Burkholderiales bacterium]|jgi:tripartite-type tricarboxylate transporter receptor subunit TctC